MAFASWLRTNSQHYLIVAAQSDIAKREHRSGPVRYGGFKEIFWLSFFVPIYRVLPWRLRHFVMRSMPGSHRRHWDYPTDASGPAI